MNKEKIEEIREYVMERLTLIARGSYPKEQRFMENVLALTTEVSQSSSSASKLRNGLAVECELRYETKSGSHTFTMCECGRQGRRSYKCILCLNEELDKINSQSKSKAKSEDNN